MALAEPCSPMMGSYKWQVPYDSFEPYHFEPYHYDVSLGANFKAEPNVSVDSELLSVTGFTPMGILSSYLVHCLERRKLMFEFFNYYTAPLDRPSMLSKRSYENLMMQAMRPPVLTQPDWPSLLAAAVLNQVPLPQAPVLSDPMPFAVAYHADTVCGGVSGGCSDTMANIELELDPVVKRRRILAHKAELARLARSRKKSRLSSLEVENDMLRQRLGMVVCFVAIFGVVAIHVFFMN